MYLEKIRLENIKCFEDIEIDFTYGRNKPRLMTVILGDNGVGKTTLLQTIAIALGGENVTRFFLVGPLVEWHRIKSDGGLIQAVIVPGKSDKDAPKRKLSVGYYTWKDEIEIDTESNKDWEILEKTAYAMRQEGWLACGYGPLRRFTNRRISEVLDTKIDRFASLFGQNEQLIPVEDWLIELDRRALITEREGQDANYRQLFNQLAQTLLQVLPEENLEKVASINIIDSSSYIRTTTEGILWRDGFDNWVTLSQLSDGYQSIMSWTGDLVSRLVGAFPKTENFLDQEGIVLIDEVDLHLHPTWQRKILNQLRQTFPKIQFIVTTHSPLVAASAKEGELFVLKHEQNKVVVEPELSVQGWRVDQILTSSLFDLDTTRDPETEQQLARYDELLAVRARGKLNATQTKELDTLEEKLGQRLPPPGETPEQQQLYQEMQKYITLTLREKGK